MATVSKPTPGNGREQTRSPVGRLEVYVADELAVDTIHADVDHRRAGLDPAALDEARLADRGDRGCPARPTISGRFFVREWQIVTVALRCRSRSATGLPTISLRPITTAFAPSILTPWWSST